MGFSDNIILRLLDDFATFYVFELLKAECLLPAAGAAEIVLYRTLLFPGSYHDEIHRKFNVSESDLLKFDWSNYLKFTCYCFYVCVRLFLLFFCH